MSSEAARWVMQRCQSVPKNLRYTLLALATYADPTGRGMRPSAATLAEGTGKSKRQIEKDLAALRALGTIRQGDQALVAHLAKDHRPVVYDLADMVDATPLPSPTTVGEPVESATHRRPRRWSTVTHDADPPSPTTDKTYLSKGERPARQRAGTPSGAPATATHRQPPLVFAVPFVQPAPDGSCSLHAGWKAVNCGPCRSERIERREQKVVAS